MGVEPELDITFRPLPPPPSLATFPSRPPFPLSFSARSPPTDTSTHPHPPTQTHKMTHTTNINATLQQSAPI